MSLTDGAIQRMFTMSGSSDDPSFLPSVQILHLKKIAQNGGADDRWKVVLSDGNRFLSGMCATQLNIKVNSGEIAQFGIINVNEFLVNTLPSGQKIVIVLRCELVQNPGSRIGNPVDITKAGNVGSAQAQPSGGVGGGAQPMYGKVESAGNPYGGGGSNPYGSRGNSGGMGMSGQGSSNPVIRTNASSQSFTPISGLNMYSNRWVIRAKITNKSEIRTWSNAKGEGSLFSVVVLDSSGTDVKCTFFKEAVDKFYNLLEEGRVYTFSGGRLKVANMQYNTCKSQFEITFDQNSEIHLQDDAEDIQESYDFVKIAALSEMEPSGFVDILAVVKHVADPAVIVSKKSGKEMTKCELTIQDDSGADVRLTVWGDLAANAQTKFANLPIVAFKRARISDYGGRSLSGSGCSVNPTIPQANQLRQWWADNGSNTQARSLSSAGGGARGADPFEQRKTVSSIKEEQLGYNEKPDWLSFKATITFLKKDKAGDEGAWYTACFNSGDPCKNMFKATQTSDGFFHCDKCQQTNEKCVRRFIFSGTVADDTSTSWVSVFNEQAESMFNGVKADELYEKIAEGDRDSYDSTFAKASCTEWIIKCKVKQEHVGDESRVKTSIVSLTPIDYAAESRNLLAALGV
ncbi:replication factor A protein 1 family protein [Skeletonema marinoi]|uniref:Replication protein A subunit n=1 Tax=Skeletonema marinoi TaxID=267567 RepID=A0AAD8Y039_9STRA|nr:replication factor A protein 1 family protein [Skeletonema marinoi]